MPESVEPMDASAPLLRVEGIVKEFPGVRALDGVDFDVRAGEVHCLLGQNGAGKSTLIKVLAGAHQPDAGTIVWRGEPVTLPNPHAAMRLGVATIYQEFDLVDGLSVAENIHLGNLPSRLGFTRRLEMMRATRQILARLGHPEIRPDREVGLLAPAGKQLVSMARALSYDARLIVMDEPSAALAHDEVSNLFRIVRDLTGSGVAVVYISHRLDEIRRIGDRVTVLADGRTTATGLPATTPTDELVEFMVGRKVDQLYPERPVGTDRVLLEVRDARRLPAVRGVSLTVRAGEIVGLGGLVGSGRTELLRLVYGLDQPEGGEFLVEGKPLRPNRPGHAIRRGLGLAPEDRKSQALVLDWSQTKNVTVADLSRFSRVLLDVRKERASAHKQLRSLNTVPDDPDRVVRLLSGGNQQKVVLARWLLHECRVLLLDEPTRGVDVATKAEIYRIISDLATSGLGVLVVSSELEELVGICTRILVMRDGEIVAEVDGNHATEHELLRHAVAPTDAPELTEEVV
ncbi:MAG: sugar ABC transporter ATP-binding protein [Actinomycetes bacterium]